MESDKEKQVRKENRRVRANILSAVTFSWTLPVFWEGRKKEFTLDDLSEPLKEHNSANLGEKIERAWNEEIIKSKKISKEPSLIRVIVKIFGTKILLFGTVPILTHFVIKIAQPLLLGGLISYFAPGSSVSKNEAYLYAGGVFLCTIVNTIVENAVNVGKMHLGMKLRVAACSLIYRKSLQLNKISMGQTSVGQIINLMSNDVSRFDFSFHCLHDLWIGPLQTALITYLMWQFVGVASIIGVAVLLLLIPFQGYLGKLASTLRLKTAKRTDRRVHLMNEIINGIQVIKMYTWEMPFVKLVAEARRKEVNVIRKSTYLFAMMTSFLAFHTRTALFVTILSYVLLGNNITAEKVFVLSAFYTTLRESMSLLLPIGIHHLAETLGSIKRIKTFLMIEASESELLQLEENNLKEKNDKILSPMNYEHITENVTKPSIFMKKACAKWLPESADNTLDNISLEVIPGQLTVIVGTVGSGKTSLFHLLLKELSLNSGTIKIFGRISYASQESWLFHGSVRQNILFGEPYNKLRYQQVVKSCALIPDFEQFPYGDKSIVGERGILLSGGQRARVNLARAVYKQADIYLLDDPLSAVDSHVGKHLFEDCIQTFLKDKTIILITHQLQFLETVDQIVLLENGKIMRSGTYNELRKLEEFNKLMVSTPEREEIEIKPKRIRRLSSRTSVQSETSMKEETKSPDDLTEHQSKGSVSGAVYAAYLKAGGGICYMLFIVCLCVVSQGVMSGSDYWLTYWVNLEEHVYPKNITESNTYPIIASREVCIYVFSGLTVGTIIFAFTKSFMFYNLCMNASKTLHNIMFQGVIRATMWFFNNNPSGRILNRFSKDVGIMDILICFSIIDIVKIFLNLLSIVIIIASVNVWLLIPSLVCGVIFYFMRTFYLTTSRTLKRLEGVSKSPVVSHLKTSLQGLTTIRAFKLQNDLIKEFDNHQDLNSSAWYLYTCSSGAFGLWLNTVCAIYVGIVAMSFLTIKQDTFGGDVGLAISQAIALAGMLQWGIRQTAELENQITSVERIMEYANLESEPPLESSPDKKPDNSWPQKGKIEFSNLNLRYSLNEAWVLNKLSFSIKPEEKVGIVGRTGAGKSSLISALFRLAENDGLIEIDGIDISTIGLHDLRSKISIIPQEPILFSGSLRKNLDPFEEHNDDVLWTALDEVELKEVVQELAGGLYGEISEGGSNMSVGQRQLICLARAIIKNNKILVLDEATANVDPMTDSLIQKTIRKKFEFCTVLTIAHRLNTIMDTDKVLVMSDGCLVEFDYPHILLQNPDGYFYQMVQQTGKNTEEALHSIAAESFAKVPHHTSQ